jgi:hypothetical protein
MNLNRRLFLAGSSAALLAPSGLLAAPELDKLLGVLRVMPIPGLDRLSPAARGLLEKVIPSTIYQYNEQVQYHRYDAGTSETVYRRVCTSPLYLAFTTRDPSRGSPEVVAAIDALNRLAAGGVWAHGTLGHGMIRLYTPEDDPDQRPTYAVYAFPFQRWFYQGRPDRVARVTGLPARLFSLREGEIAS